MRRAARDALPRYAARAAAARCSMPGARYDHAILFSLLPIIF
jgi:hypothetical protein